MKQDTNLPAMPRLGRSETLTSRASAKFTSENDRVKCDGLDALTKRDL